MEFENLKSNWKKAGKGVKDQEEIFVMTKIKNHPNIKRIRIKFFIETFSISVFLVMFYNGFDGGNKPLWANLLLIGGSISFLVIRIMGWHALRNPIKGDNLKTSLILFENKLQRITFFVLLSSFLFGLSIILFFATSIAFTKGKYFMLAGMVLTLILLVYLSSRNWFKRVESINTTLLDFNNDSE